MEKWGIPILSAAVGALTFAMFFGVRSRKLIWCTVGGALTWATYLVSLEFGLMEAGAYALGAAAGTLYAEILARVVKTPVSMFALTSLIPMVPGGALYYTMLGLLNGDKEAFVEKAFYTLTAAGSMAMGMFAATMLFRIFFEGIRSLADRSRRA